MLELLAPAGSMEALQAAVQNGADAVYLGCGSFNARQNAKNFTPQMLAEAIQYAHVRGTAIHLTLNILVTDREIDDVCELIRFAANAGVDAFIVQDLGIVRLCRAIAPHVPIHGSTQMSVHSLAGVQMLAAMGISRVVLSRELSRDEIAYICRNSPVEIEVFAHGALCMCYSGQCYLSGIIGGRSGNRGRCAQPCRQSYGFGRSENRYPLSLKDNCLASYMGEMEDLGVASVKLEGRMKRAEYVAAVTGVYRRAIDENRVTPEMKQTLLTAFNRQGFTDGYYTGKIGPQMFGIREDTREDPQFLQTMRQTYEMGENGRVKVEFLAQITSEGSCVTVKDPDGRVCSAVGPMPEVARSTPLLPETVEARLAKTGGTPYRCTGATAVVEPGLTISAAAINAMRRSVLDQLTAQRARIATKPLGRPERIAKARGWSERPGLTVQVTAREQVTEALLRRNPEVLYIPLHILAADPEWTAAVALQCNVAAVLPRIVHDGENQTVFDQLRRVRALGVKEVLASNLGHLIPARELGFGIRGDFGLNLYNSYAMQTLADLELRSACLSFELTMPRVRDLNKSVPTELIVYGRLPLMVTENCIIRNRTGQCTCHLGPTKLVDKTGAEFPVIKDGASCRSVLLNGKKLYWLDRKEDLQKLGLWATRLYFTTENSMEVDKTLDAFAYGRAMEPGECTRGLYLRGVE